MACTGERFTSRWSTWRDLRGEPPERMSLSLRQLYLQRWFGSVRVQAGSLAPVKGDVSPSGLEDLGWIDGVRVEGHADDGLGLEGVVGSLADVDEPDLFIRQRRLNYGELEVEVPLPSHLQAEVAVHHLDGASYTKAELGWHHDDALGSVDMVRGEAGVEVVGGGTLALVHGQVDPAALPGVPETLRDWVSLRAMVRWVDPAYGDFGALSEDFYQFGTELRLRADGDLEPNDRLGWSVRYIAPVTAGLAPRLDLSLTARLRL